MFLDAISRLIVTLGTLRSWTHCLDAFSAGQESYAERASKHTNRDLELLLGLCWSDLSQTDSS